MPVYVYECTKCKRKFEVVQGIKDATLTKHSDCTEGHIGLPDVCDGGIKRILQSPNLQFNGKGTPKFFEKKKPFNPLKR